MDVELNLTFAFGRGELSEADERFFVLLRAVNEYGSLRRASAAAGLSYRAAWGMLKEWSDHLGRAPVALHRGRGAALNEFGHRLLWAHEYARSRLEPTLKTVAQELNEVLESALFDAAERRLTVHASHSMAQDILRELAAEQAGLSLEFHNHGSLDCLRDLKNERCDLAGFHLAEGTLRPRLAPLYRPWLDGADLRLIRVAARRQGLMCRRDVKSALRGVVDLAGRDIRFVNRQVGSGTRALLDGLLANEGVDPAAIRGYTHEEFTHSAVAALLSSGAADAAFGVEAAARQFGLEFLPVVSETYYFAVREDTVKASPAVQQLVSVVAGSPFRRRVAALGGYDPRYSGRWESTAALFD